MKHFPAALLCLMLVLTNCPATELGPIEPQAGKTTDELIKQLASDDFATREAAMRQLMSREDAAPALRKARNSPDREVARRASEALEGLTHRRVRGLVENGEVDRLIDWLVSVQEPHDEQAGLQGVAELAWKLVSFEKRNFHKARIPVFREIPFRDFARYRSSVCPRFIVSPRPVVEKAGSYVIRGQEVSIKVSTAHDLFVSSGRIRASEQLVNSVILAADSIDVEAIGNWVVICDGDGTVRKALNHCIIISRGAVNCPERVSNCLIVTGGPVRFRKDSVVSNATIQCNEARFLGLVNFFDLVEVGLEVEPAKGGVRVKKAREATPLARAGLQAGDLVIAVEGTTVDSPDCLRRLLGKGLARTDEFMLRVRRLDRVLEIRVQGEGQ